MTNKLKSGLINTFTKITTKPFSFVSGTLIFILFLSLFLISYKRFNKFSLKNVPNTNMNDLSTEISEEKFSGMSFFNDCASGEEGILLDDKTIEGIHGRDFIPEDTRSDITSGRWFISEGVLVIKGTTLSDGRYENPKIITEPFGSYIYDFRLDGCGIVVGLNSETIGSYQSQ